MTTFSLISIVKLLERANDAGIIVSFSNDELALSIRKGKPVNQEILEELRQHKPFLIQYFRQHKVKEHGPMDMLPDEIDRSKQERLPLSFAQERLWFIDKLQGSIQYHMPWVFRLEGLLNKTALESAFRMVIQRHEVLRTVILEEAGIGHQHIKSAADWQMKYVTEEAIHKAGHDVGSYIADINSRPYDLSADWMLKVTLIEKGDNSYTLCILLHHIAFDGWSVSILVRELTELYFSYTKGIKPLLSSLPLQYADYAIWQRQYLSGERLEKKMQYWLSQLKDVEPLAFPADYTRPKAQIVSGREACLLCNNILKDALLMLSQEENVTLYMTLLAAFKVLIYRYVSQSDICVGSPVAGRQQQQLESLIGFFVNTLAIRSHVTGSMSFSSLLQHIKQTTLEAYEHQDVPFEKIVESLGIERDMSRSAVFQVMFALQNTPSVSEPDLGDIRLVAENNDVLTSRFDVSLTVTLLDTGMQVRVVYNDSLYSVARMDRLLVHYRHLLEAIVADRHTVVGELRMLGEEEQQQLLHDFNTSIPVIVREEDTLPALFRAVALRTPSATALLFEDTPMSYAMLDAYSDQLAAVLQHKGVKAGSLVPLCIDRSLEMIISILGILKAGGAYVPIDPGYPLSRITYMLEDTGAQVVVSNQRCKTVLLAGISSLDVVVTEEVLSDQSNYPVVLRGPGGADPAYVIYTSGSTGRPKGVMVSQRSVVRLIHAQSALFNIDATERILQFSNYSFDASVEQLFLALLNGATLVLFREGLQLETVAFEQFLLSGGITHLHATPGFLETLTPFRDGSLRRVIAGGESCSKALAARWQEVATFYNEYGPTETTVTATIYRYDVEHAASLSSLPIGKPLPGVQAYILDESGNPVPVGVTGELYLGGEQVAMGYLHLPDQTAARFVADPWSADAGGRLYRTGDLARWLADGNIEYNGRIDEQVKVRGYRIELGEIAAVLEESSYVQQAVVVVAQQRLVAYVVGAAEEEDKIRAYLQGRLPEYMHPSLLIPLASLPLTSNGKIDKRALPDPLGYLVHAESYIAPRTSMESSLARIWSAMLGVDQVGISDNFFALGGHSLLVTRLVSAIRKELGLEVSVKDIFIYPTIGMLSAHLEDGQLSALLPAISRHPHTDRLPLSFAQERLWFIDRLQGSIPYHMPWIFRVSGRLDIGALTAAFREIVHRHEILRTVIREESGVGYQHILPWSDWSLQYLPEREVLETHASVGSYLASAGALPFDLSSDYMLRVMVIGHGTEDHTLFVLLHHIAFDGWSVSVLTTELMTLYRSYVLGEGVVLPSLPVQYADYSWWQRHYLQGALLDRELSYWESRLSGVTPLAFPVDYPRPAIQSMEGDSVSTTLPLALSEELLALSREEGVTMFMTLLAAFKVLLYRYTGQSDICVGTGVANRNHQEIEGLIGFFVNALALRSEVSGDQPFSSFLQQVKAETLSAYEHQEVPFEKVVEMLGVDRDMSRTPVFQVMFILQNTPDVFDAELYGLSLENERFTHVTSKFDFTFSLRETRLGIKLHIEYATSLYCEQTVSRLLVHYHHLLEAIVADRHTVVGKLRMLGEEEQQQLLHDFNTSIPVIVREEDTLPALFRAVALRTPSATALLFEDTPMSYAMLDAYSDQLAAVLQHKGVKAGSLVPLCIDRSLEMIISILGILKAGGAYVPIDPGYPLSRITYMLEDTGAQVVVSNQRCKTVLLAGISSLDVVVTEEVLSDQSNYPVVLRGPGGADPAYVIYTSGSTGRPKGVMVSQRSVVRLIHAQSALFNIDATERILQFSNYSFDASVEQLFLALLNGATLVLFREGLQLETVAFEQFLLSGGITHLHATPGFLETLTPFRDGSLRRVIAGGESCSKALAARWQEVATFYNEYGPTETTVTATIYRYDVEHAASLSSLPIGKPLPGVQAYILDESGNPVPVGVTGELYLGGEQVAMGYLHLPDQTAARFVADPWSADAGGRLYRTGDLARWLADGNIEYNGRIDEQVKVRGYRIELGEIAAVLEESSYVQQAVVVVAQQRLVAYVVGAAEEEDKIRAYLQGRLPEYMHPSLLIPLASLPLTSNGKIDKRALPDPLGYLVHAESYIAPRTSMESSLARIWSAMLGVDQVGISDNFFALGGHSLLVTRLVSAIRKELGLEVSVKDIFIYPTIGMLSAHLEDGQLSALLPAISRHPHTDRLPLSFAQERLWFIDRLQGSIPYHMPWIFRVSGRLDIGALTAAFREIVHRHEILRTVIREESGVGYQHILPWSDWSLQYLPEREVLETHASVGSYLASAGALPFDLSSDYMLRVMVIGHGTEDHTLFVLLHHIAFDGWSVSVLTTELMTLYRSYVLGEGVVLPSLPVQYADYSWWQRHYLQGALLDRELSYWESRLSGVTPLAFPVDYPRPAIQSMEGDSVSTTLPLALSEELLALSREEGVTMFMTLLAAFKVLLYRYTGQSDICVGTGVANRNHQEIEGLIGFFVNALALRSEVSGDQPFSSFLQQVKAETLSAYEHQEVPFEKVVEMLGVDRDMSRTPVFQVMFTLQNTPEADETELYALTLTPVAYAHITAKYDLSISVRETSVGISIYAEYSTALFRKETVRRLLGHYQNLLAAIVSDRHEVAGKFLILTAAERHQLLFDFNDTTVGYPETTFVSLFDCQAVATPDNIALKDHERQLSYKELQEKVTRLAQLLRGKGVGKEILVPVLMHRSMEMLISILGILKAGGAYVPIDPDAPASRIAYLLKDTDAQLILSDNKGGTVLTAVDIPVVNVQDENIYTGQSVSVGDLPEIDPYQLAYVIYTSGSTGTPKGVMIAHNSLLNYLLNSKKRYIDDNAGIGSLAHLSYTFDASLTALFVPLLVGKCIVLASARGIETFNEEDLSAHGVYDFIKLTPAHMSLLEPYIVRHDSGFARRIILGGEALYTGHVQSLVSRKLAVDIVNEYGPTEATVGATVYTCRASGEGQPQGYFPIGRPLDNVHIYIVNDCYEPVPIGVTGELWIGGIQVARGYLHQPALTAKQFIDSPFIAGERVYKTGDLARWLPDGNIEYVGRRDEQVKIRGYRMEPGEVETVLYELNILTANCVVVKKDTTGNNKLVAYYVPEAGVLRKFGESTEQLQRHVLMLLKERLPDYMIPQDLIVMEQLPLTTNGKIDRIALTGRDDVHMGTSGYVAPGTDTEKMLARIWQELLEVERVGLQDNFFELGGHSLLAVQLLHRLSGEHISLDQLFDCQDIRSQAALIEKGRTLQEMFLQKKEVTQPHLVLLRGGKAERPLFILPGSKGVSNAYETLAMAIDIPYQIFGIQMQGSLDGEAPLQTMIDIAKQNVAWVQEIQQHGPYRLVGHSFGGCIAYEMAVILEEQGEQVEVLGIIDVAAGDMGAASEPDINRAALMTRIAAGIFEQYGVIRFPYPHWISELEHRMRNEHSVEGMKQLLMKTIDQQITTKPVGLSAIMQLFELQATNEMMPRQLSSRKLNVPLVLIKGAETGWDKIAADLGWERYFTGVQVSTVPGNHDTMLQKSVTLIGKQLAAKIN